jgi:hypothetical protein
MATFSEVGHTSITPARMPNLSPAVPVLDRRHFLSAAGPPFVHLTALSPYQQHPPVPNSSFHHSVHRSSIDNTVRNYNYNFTTYRNLTHLSGASNICESGVTLWQRRGNIDDWEATMLPKPSENYTERARTVFNTLAKYPVERAERKGNRRS